MKKISLTVIYLIAFILLFSISCNTTEDNTADAIREQITGYRKQISDLNREIALLERQLSDMGEHTVTNSAIRVSVNAVTTDRFDNYFKINGSVEAVQEAIISPEISGQVKSILVSEGKRIAAGQTVAILNTSVIENNIEELKTNLEFAKTVYERQKGLWEQEIGSEIQYLEARNAYQSMESRLRSLESQLDMAVLRSPVNGIVDQIFLKEGELAIPGSPVMQIINLEKLNINAEVSENYLPMIDPSEKVILRFPAFPDFQESVPVHRIGNVINPENRTFRLQLRIDNPGEQFKPNMIASLSIRLHSEEDVVVVPSILIKQDARGYYLFVANKTDNGNWQAQKAYIERGEEGEGKTMVKSGLNPGELMVIRGNNQLAEGVSLIIDES
jgi:membrane fusion protein, multidrug efflux system